MTLLGSGSTARLHPDCSSNLIRGASSTRSTEQLALRSCAKSALGGLWQPIGRQKQETRIGIELVWTPMGPTREERVSDFGSPLWAIGVEMSEKVPDFVIERENETISAITPNGEEAWTWLRNHKSPKAWWVFGRLAVPHEEAQQIANAALAEEFTVERRA
jgi:hypothetical protein